MSCLPKFPFCPLQAGYAFDLVDGILSSGLDGGPSFRRLDTTGNPFVVNVSWALARNEYDMFMGYVRNWIRSGGDPFLIGLILEGSEMTEYQASFIPGTIKLASKNGGVFTVSAQLEALPNFVSPCDDGWAASALLNAHFGDDVCRISASLSEVVNEDLVYVRT